MCYGTQICLYMQLGAHVCYASVANLLAACSSCVFSISANLLSKFAGDNDTERTLLL